MIMMKRILLAFFVLSMALSATAQRVYINPGHGDWGPNSRPMATVPFPNLHATTGGPDTLGFYESNTNLWKAFALNEKLQGAGYTTMMSRTENGPYPYVYGDESIDKPLLDICAEVNLFEADYFISIHSNANVDGDNVNYPLIIHSGYDGAGFRDERNMALHTWPRLFEAFGNDKDHKNIEQGFEPNSAYSLDNRNVRGSISFYGYNLSTLLHDYQGYLVEGYFHTYQPARHRALNPEWCRQEGIRYFRGIQDYFDKPDEEVGYIMGCVRSLTEMSYVLQDRYNLFKYMDTSYDAFLPINGAKVVLRDASGNIIRTECYRHVARHITDQYYYTTDHNYNGIFVFENLDPGKYTLTVHAVGYKDTSMIVNVAEDATVYPEIFLTKGQGTEPNIDVDVTWVLNGGKVDVTLPSKIEGSDYTLPTPTRAGYIFLGWYDTNSTSGNKLTILPVGYKGTVYALWQSTSVKWQLNGGKVYPDNQWLWDDFQKTKLNRTELVSVADAWKVIKDVADAEFSSYLAEGSEYAWLGDYLWSKFGHIQDDGTITYTRWKDGLYALLNCKSISLKGETVDFTEAGKPAKWREFAQYSWRVVDSRFYTPITLPDQITSLYTIPTPEKEGFEFVGWYDTNNTTGTELITLPEGYNSTVYAIWKMPTLNKVVWVLNDGHVYHSNDWLWQDFMNTFKDVSATNFTTRPETYADFSRVWSTSETNCYMLTPVDGYSSASYTRYHWLGDYLWAKAWTASASTNEQSNMSGGNEWWGKLLWACLTCTACEYTLEDNKTTIAVDFSVAGQPKSWRKYAIDNKDTKNIAQDFYTEITLPEEIDVDYTIPTPEKEGYTFQGWYNNHKGEGERITELKVGSTGMIYAIWQEPVPCIVAYDLNCNYLPGKMAFEFSFYANSLPVSGKLIFYNKDGQNPEEYQLSNLRQGKNTISIQAQNIQNIPELEDGKDIYWDVELEARPSTLFAEFFRSSTFNTAYATIDNNPASDFFGSIWVANQQNHGYSNGVTDGGIWRLVPEQGYARDEGAFAGGREVIFRPTVAPDGKVYLTDNGKSHGGVFVMDPHTKQITNFFEGCTYDYENGEWKKDGQVVGSGSTGAHIWTENGESKLYLMHNAHANDDANGVTKGFFVYDLNDNNLQPQHITLKNIPNQTDGIQDYVNTGVTDYAIVGTSRGAWVCQTRKEDKNVISDPSLTFYPSDNTTPTIFTNSLDASVGGIFGDNELIHGSFGSAIAVNKAENLLAMVGGTGNIMLFDIEWSDDDDTTPTLTNKRDYPIVADDPTTIGEWNIPTITTLNFDYAGNLVATLGETYNDASDQHQVAIFTLPKAVNKVDVPARKSQLVPSLVEDEQCASVAEANKRYQTVKLYRKLQSGMYNTICLPFGINSLEGTPYQGASVVKFVGTEIQTVGGEDMLKLKFSQVTSMQAGVPYLIKPLQDIKDPMLFYSVEMGNSVNAQAVTRNGVTFQGTMDPTELPNQNMLMLVANNRLATSTGGTMQGNRGYFVIGDNLQNMPKRAEIAIVKGAPSSDDYIHIDDYQPSVTKVLENGLIVIIRDGVKYNLMGARVR